MADIFVQNVRTPGRRPYEALLKRLTSDDGEEFTVFEVGVQYGDQCKLFDVSEEELRGIRDTINAHLGLGDPSPGEVIDWFQKQDVPYTEVESSGLVSVEALTDALIDLCADAREKFGVPS